MLAEHLSK